MPQPSSATTEVGERIPCVQRGFVGEDIQSAKRGVILQRTERKMVSENQKATASGVSEDEQISWVRSDDDDEKQLQ